MPQKSMECFRLLLDHLAWIEHKRFKQGRKSVRDNQRCRRSKEVNTPELIGQRVRVRVRVTMLRFYLTKMGIKTVPHPPHSPDLAPCDFWSFPKLRGCRYETIEEMKEAVTKVSDTLTWEDFHGAFQRLVERYNKCIAAGGDYFEGD